MPGRRGWISRGFPRRERAPPSHERILTTAFALSPHPHAHAAFTHGFTRSSAGGCGTGGGVTTERHGAGVSVVSVHVHDADDRKRGGGARSGLYGCRRIPRSRSARESRVALRRTRVATGSTDVSSACNNPCTGACERGSKIVSKTMTSRPSREDEKTSRRRPVPRGPPPPRPAHPISYGRSGRARVVVVTGRPAAVSAAPPPGDAATTTVRSRFTFSSRRHAVHASVSTAGGMTIDRSRISYYPLQLGGGGGRPEVPD